MPIIPARDFKPGDLLHYDGIVYDVLAVEQLHNDRLLGVSRLRQTVRLTLRDWQHRVVTDFNVHPTQAMQRLTVPSMRRRTGTRA